MAAVPTPPGMFPVAYRTLAVVIAGAESAGVVWLAGRVWFEKIPEVLKYLWFADGLTGALRGQASGDAGLWTLRVGVEVVLLLVVFFLAGQVLDLLSAQVASIVERPDWGRSKRFRPWMERLVGPNYCPDDWMITQFWIWESPRAQGEFGQLRFQLMMTRDAAFSALLAALVCWVGAIVNPIGGNGVAGLFFVIASAGLLVLPFLAYARCTALAILAGTLTVTSVAVGVASVSSWSSLRGGFTFAGLIVFPVLVWLFFYAWATVGRIHNDLVKDAGEMGRPGS